MPSLSSLEFMVDHNAQLVPGFAALSQRLFRAGEWDSLMVPAGPFAHGEALSPLSNALQAGVPLLPV